MLCNLFKFLIIFRHKLFDWALLRINRAEIPVISIGGIEAGGSGKTPITIEVIKFLQKKGLRPVLLSRGYGRKTRKTIVAKVGQKLKVQDIGDEPSMILEKTGIAGIISRERWRDFRLVKNLEADILIMDDGFQHRQLHRDIDIVVVRGGKPLDERKFLPCRTDGSFAKSLREIPGRLAKADLILTRNGFIPDIYDYSAVSNISFSYNFKQKIAMGKSLLVTSIAETSGLVRMLEQEAVEIVHHVTFEDHHNYSNRDLSKIGKLALANNVSQILTTEKDATKLPRFIGNIPVIAIVIEVEFNGDFEGKLDFLIRRSK